jgi:hypothetical protein
MTPKERTTVSTIPVERGDMRTKSKIGGYIGVRGDKIVRWQVKETTR